MYLLDTNVVSELRRPRPHGAVVEWISGIPADQIYLSAVTIGEIQAGIEITRRQDVAKAEELERWLNGLATGYAILPMDGAVFRAWAQIKAGKSDTLIEDAMIAATAQVHRLIVATRNVADFEALGVAVVNPFGTS